MGCLDLGLSIKVIVIITIQGLTPCPTFFMTALSPGIFFVLIAGIVNAISINVQKKSLGLPGHKELKARGGVDYYKLENINRENDD